MAGIEFTEETKQQVERIGSADIVIGIAGPVAPEELRTRAERIIAELGTGVPPLRFVFAWPGAGAEPTMTALNGDESRSLTMFPFAPPAYGGGEFWAAVSANQRAILALASSLNARACILLGSDLAALQAHAVQLFAYSILDRQCGLAMPLYPVGKYEALVNNGILSPLSRALYGRRIRYPIAFDFAASGPMCARLARGEPGAEHSVSSLLWPVTIAATQSPQDPVGQVYIDVHHEVSTGGLDLSAVLGQVVGSMFHEMETFAAQWQRIRGSQTVPGWGNPPAEEPDDGEPPDPTPMFDSFLLGSKNLSEVWQLVLPPNTMLELRRLTRAGTSSFHMPDELWACIVYDFALAWRLRTISRVHLLGALTPLYLGWAASYVREAAGLTRAALEQRMEQFARAWEDKKPYLLSRWRWPDRFNP
jgi:hypothetical protein